VDSCLLSIGLRSGFEVVSFMANTTYPAVRQVAVGNRFIALWDSVIGKKVVMAGTRALEARRPARPPAADALHEGVIVP
jgi:hypothetical protein